LGNHRCKAHGHDYLSHYQCYLTENPCSEKRGYFDIETFTSNYHADRGLLLCYCIKPLGEKKIIGRSITPEEIFNKKKGRDKQLVKECVEHMREFDRLYTWYGSWFDIPWIRARAVRHKIKFIGHGERLHKDLYVVGKKFKFSSKGLENMARQLLGSTRKTRFDYDRWLDAVLGDKKALNNIFQHCKYDVMDLADLHPVLAPYYVERDTSI
jgi:uncharacterized protein YprB with RNaseH-like and TPR domain